MTASDDSTKAALLIAIQVAGSEGALARRINGVQLPLPAGTAKKSQHVSKWKVRGACPPDQVLRIEAVTGVSRHKLRPDVFGYEPIPVPAAAQQQEAAE